MDRQHPRRGDVTQSSHPADGTVLVTGGTGLLGAAVVGAAVAAGRDVVATWHHRPPPADPAVDVAGAAEVADDPSAVRWERLDLTGVGAAARLVRSVSPSLVIHTAYVESGSTLDRVTGEAPGELAAACAAGGARLVHVSSDVVLDGRCGHVYRDDAPAAPLGPYGRAKAAAEQAVLDADPSAAVVRTSLLLAPPRARPGRHERLVLEAAARRAEVTFFDDEVRCPLVVDDLAGALLALGAGSHAGTMNAAGGDAVSRAELATRIARSRSVDPAALRTGPTPPSLAGRPRCLVLDSTSVASISPLRGVRDVLSAPDHRG